MYQIGFICTNALFLEVLMLLQRLEEWEDGNHGEVIRKGQGKKLCRKGHQAAQSTEVTVRLPQAFLKTDFGSTESSITG